MSTSFNYKHLHYFWVVAKERGIALAAMQQANLIFQLGENLPSWVRDAVSSPTCAWRLAFATACPNWSCIDHCYLAVNLKLCKSAFAVRREKAALSCVQRRLACLAGVRPAGVAIRSPVAWIAVRRESDQALVGSGGVDDGSMTHWGCSTATGCVSPCQKPLQHDRSHKP